jgi:5-epi-alpha-selinene synthase
MLGHPPIPELYCPFPSAMSPHARAVQPLLNEWMQQRRYLRTEAARERFEAGRFAWLTGRVHPGARFEPLVLVGMYMSWLFMLDDLCDEAELGWTPQRLKALHEELIERMRYPSPLRGDENPVVEGLAELWGRLCERAAPGWPERFTRTFENYARACVWEAENRVHQRVPSLAEYMERRRYTSGLYLFFDLIELADEVSLSDEELEHIRALRERANDGVAWFNDIVSLEKELRAGDVHNLVVVLRQEHQLRLEEAVAQAVRLFNARMREYVELECTLPSLGVESDERVQRYLTGLRCWVRGNMDWSYESGRYGQARPEAAGVRCGS